jgi:hypothetical protein
MLVDANDGLDRGWAIGEMPTGALLAATPMEKPREWRWRSTNHENSWTSCRICTKLHDYVTHSVKRRSN